MSESGYFGFLTEVAEPVHMGDRVLADRGHLDRCCKSDANDFLGFDNVAALVRIGPALHKMKRPAQHNITQA